MDSYPFAWTTPEYVSKENFLAIAYNWDEVQSLKLMCFFRASHTKWILKEGRKKRSLNVYELILIAPKTLLSTMQVWERRLFSISLSARVFPLQTSSFIENLGNFNFQSLKK